MAFDSSVITRVYPPAPTSPGAVRLRWEASSPAGTTFQVYASGLLVWAGAATTCVIPTPSGKVRIEIGAVGAAEKDLDFSGSLQPAPLDRATITWTGGPALGDDLAGFHVYQGASAGGPIDYSRPVATIPAYAGGKPVAGVSESSYRWVSPPLRSGSWSFGVRSFDVNGNEGAAMEGVVVVAIPPEPPTRDGNGVRLTYVYDPAAFTVTLSWLPSPG